MLLEEGVGKDLVHIYSPCECEHNNPDSLDVRLFPSVVLAVAPAVTMDEASSLSQPATPWLSLLQCTPRLGHTRQLSNRVGETTRPFTPLTHTCCLHLSTHLIHTFNSHLPRTPTVHTRYSHLPLTPPTHTCCSHLLSRPPTRVLEVVRTVAAPPSIVVKCGGVVLRVVVCGVVLVVSCVVLCLLCVCVGDLFIFLHLLFTPVVHRSPSRPCPTPRPKSTRSRRPSTRCTRNGGPWHSVREIAKLWPQFGTVL